MILPPWKRTLSFGRTVAVFPLHAILLALAVIVTASCSRPPQLPPLASDAVILAFGDSLTAGTGAAETESYPAVLSGLTGRRVVNAGVPGELSADGVRRLPELLEREPVGLLILCHGGNDLLAHRDHSQIADNLRIMIRTARDRGIPVVLIAVPAPDLSLEPPRLYADLADEFQLPIEQQALARILGKGSLKSDYIHPNAAGYRQLAQRLAGLLRKSGAITP